MQSIREFVQKLQKSRGMTQAELAKCIGYKSQTSLVRIVQETANEESLHKFVRMLRSAPDIYLTAAESAQLDLIVEKRMLSADDYAAMESMRRLLQENKPAAEEIWLVCGGGDERITLREHYARCSRLHMTLLNCEKVHIIPALAAMMEQSDLQVNHYLYAEDTLAHLAEVLRVVRPVLHEKNYAGFLCKGEAGAEMPQGLVTADLLLSEYLDAQGEWKHDVVAFTKPNEGVLAEFDGPMTAMQPLMDMVLAGAQPLRSDALVQTGQDDYLAYVRFCSDLEKDRAVYRLKPDFGIEQVPVSIWQKALEEGPLGENEEIRAIVKELVQLSQLRHRNALEKKQPTCHVLKSRAVWNFVRTGRLSDQFWGFRALTWEERLEVLQLLLRQQMNNPWFNLMLFKDDDAVCDDEVILYDDLALFIIKPGTDYSSCGDHAETMVTNKDVLKVFKHYYQDSILQFHVRTESETRMFLVELIEYCKSQMEQKKA